MTRTALPSPPTPDRAADVRRGDIDRAAMQFAIFADLWGGPIAHGPAERVGADTPTGAWGGARVITIGCEHRLFVHTLSKNWAMTVRQIGWLMVHRSLGQKTETMIPYVACVRSWPRAAVNRPERASSWARRGGDMGGRPRRHPLMAVRTIVARLEGRTNPRRPRRSMDQGPASHWGAETPLHVMIVRGIRYNWKGPPQ
jgi:hypothetical protein